MKKPDLFVYKSGLLTALLLLGTPVAQADMVDAAMYVATEQYDKAFAEYTREATNGNSEAFYWLGMMYYNGTGTTQDYNKAIDWFLRAAAEHGENGDDKAMKMLGDMNLLGQGIDKNPVSALEYYKHAADLGNADAGYITGNIYAQGLDTIKPNLTYSLIYWEQAAEAGNIPSMQNAAYLYETGLAGTKDHDKAYALYLKAAEKDYAPAQTKVGLYAKNYETKRDYAVALKWLTAAAQKQQPMAQHELGLMYLDGLGVNKDIPKMVQLFEKASANNYIPAARDLGDFYASADFGYLNMPLSFEHYLHAARLGDAQSERNTAMLYCNGNGTEKDMVRCAAWLFRATEKDAKTNEADMNNVTAAPSPTDLQRAKALATDKDL